MSSKHLAGMTENRRTQDAVSEALELGSIEAARR
jgi:hypothetical protein